MKLSVIAVAVAALIAAPYTAARPPRSINYEPSEAGGDKDFEAALRSVNFDKEHPEANIPAIVRAEDAWSAGNGAAPTTAAATADSLATPMGPKKNPNITCFLNCNGQAVVSFDALAPVSASAWNASGVPWNATRGGLAFLPRPAFGFARTRSRVCFPNVTTVAGDACFPVGSAGYTTAAGGHSAVISYTGPSPTMTISGGVRNFKSAWVSNPGGVLAFRGYNLAGQLKCSGTVPPSPGAAVDLAGAGCCSVGLLTIGYASGVSAAGTAFSLGDVKLCKATP